MPLEKYINILQELTKSKAGAFIITFVTCGIIGYIYLNSVEKNFNVVITDYQEGYRELNVKLDSCQVQKDRIYFKGFKDGSATRSEEFENARKQVMEINNLATKKEAELRKSIDKKKKQINSLKNE